jgi:phosphopantothenoylcysteine decarboxylase/phosphopantothenate--cysteine ligase
MKPRTLITAGPTREFFDPVRFISNPSTGKMGYALAAAAAEAGCAVELVSGPVALAAPANTTLHRVVTAAEMLERTAALFARCDILIMAAAVCDFRPRHYAATKVKKENLPPVVEFERTPDILTTLAARKNHAQILVGFAAETDGVERHAREKLHAKNLDLIVANQVAQTTAENFAAAGSHNAFGSDDNQVLLLARDGATVPYGPAPKSEVARWLIAQILAKANSPAWAAALGQRSFE